MIQKRAKEIRDHLHTIPEPSTKEVKTAEFLADQLKKAGFEVQTNVGGTGVIGILKGQEKGPVVAIRGDMDALTHVVNGKEQLMHTCGHDANCAITLVVAEELKKDGIKKGTLKIIFQPAEENLKGAIGMVEAGVVDDIDYLFGLHLRPIQEAKLGEASPALCHGASCMMEAVIKGVASHGARPHLGVNVVDAGAMVVNAVNAIHMDPSQPWSAKTTRFITNGKIINAVPDQADLALDLRAQTNDLLDKLIEKVTMAIENAVKTIDATVDVKVVGTVPGADYDDEVTEIIKRGIVSVLGDKGLLPAIITPGGDDFHFYKKAKPSLKVGFLGLGADLTPGLHNPEMKFNEETLQYGVKIIKQAVNELLG